MRASKFNVDKDAEKRTYDGIVFDSALEMRYYRDVVCPLEKSGTVMRHELQVPYVLQPDFIHDGKKVKAITYVADFVLHYSNGTTEVIDIKGCPDTTALLKRKLFWYVFPDIKYYWVTYSKIDGGWNDYESIKKARSLRRKEKKLKDKEVKEN